MPLEYTITNERLDNTMKKNHILLRLITLCLALAAVFSFTACTPKQPDQPDNGDQNENTGNTDATVDTNLQVNVTVLSGTTGFSMAPLMQSHADGKAKLNYNFKVEADASNVNAALINGSVDIAALPTNAASAVYNKTGGAVQILTINTLGVLYLLDNGNNITSFEDLRGKTVAAPAQNPTFIFKYLCEKNGLTVGSVGDTGVDVIIDNGYTTPAELQANVAAGNVTLAVLPEPLVTIVKSANADVAVALDLTEETQGNFYGLGMADTCARRAVEKGDPEKTYPTSLTSTVAKLSKIPMVLDNHKLAIQACIKMVPGKEPDEISMIRIGSTLDMDVIWISETLLEEAKRNPALEILGEPQEMIFDSEGNLF